MGRAREHDQTTIFGTTEESRIKFLIIFFTEHFSKNWEIHMIHLRWEKSPGRLSSVWMISVGNRKIRWITILTYLPASYWTVYFRNQLIMIIRIQSDKFLRLTIKFHLECIYWSFSILINSKKLHHLLDGIRISTLLNDRSAIFGRQQLKWLMAKLMFVSKRRENFLSLKSR